MNGSDNISHLIQKLQGSWAVSRTLLPGSILRAARAHPALFALPEHFQPSAVTHPKLELVKLCQRHVQVRSGISTAPYLLASFPISQTNLLR